MPRFALRKRETRSRETIFQKFLFSKSFGQYQKPGNNNAEWHQSGLAKHQTNLTVHMQIKTYNN